MGARAKQRAQTTAPQPDASPNSSRIHDLCADEERGQAVSHFCAALGRFPSAEPSGNTIKRARTKCDAPELIPKDQNLHWQVQSGISVVDAASRLLDPEVAARFDGIAASAQPTPPYQPDAGAAQTPAHLQNDSVPWYSEDIRAEQPPGNGKQSQTCPQTPLKHMQNACDSDEGRTGVPQHTRDHNIPVGVRNAFRWMHDCPNYEMWLLGRVRYWQGRCHQLAPEVESWRKGLSSSAQSVLPPSYHGPLHREMMEASAHIDIGLIDDIERGFPLAGAMPGTGLFNSLGKSIARSTKELNRAMHQALSQKDDTISDILARPRRLPGTSEVLMQSREEAANGKLAGPWEVYKRLDGTVHSTVPYHEWLPTVRFARVQHRPGTSYKVRPIDDCTASGLNPASEAVEKMRMSGLGAMLRAIEYAASSFRHWGEDGAPVIAKGDHKQAFRQWPVRPEHVKYAICLIWDDNVGPNGGYVAYGHQALPFGALAAVWGYTRVAASVCHILQRLFGVPQLAYVDDFFRASPRRFAALLQWVFQEVHTMLGIPLKQEKGSEPSAIMEILGMEVAATTLWAGVRLTSARRNELIECVQLALVRRTLTARDASRLGGQLSFAGGALFGRVGRASTSTITAHLGGWTPQLEQSLRWWAALLSVTLHHIQEHELAPQRAVAWVDGSWDMDRGSGAVGAVLLTPAQGHWSTSATIPQHLCDELLSNDKRQRNTQSELLAVLVLLLSCPAQLRGAELLLYEDNQAALSNLLAGSAADAQSKDLVSSIWLLLAVLRITLWVEYVHSAQNPADCFSRPSETSKQEEIRLITDAYGLVAAAPVLPSSIGLDAAGWVTALEAAAKAINPRSRHECAKTAANLGAVDTATLANQLKSLTFSGQDSRITLGWLRRRRDGMVARATRHHPALPQLLCRAARPRLQGQGCTTLVITKGHLPTAPCGRSVEVAKLVLHNPNEPQEAEINWITASSLHPSAIHLQDIAIGFYNVPILGPTESRLAAQLLRWGFPIWGSETAKEYYD